LANLSEIFWLTDAKALKMLPENKPCLICQKGNSGNKSRPYPWLTGGGASIENKWLFGGLANHIDSFLAGLVLAGIIVGLSIHD
jgi:hypothetical protein